MASQAESEIERCDDECFASLATEVCMKQHKIAGWKPLLEMTDADWKDTIENNLNGTANTIRAFAPKIDAGQARNQRCLELFRLEVGHSWPDEIRGHRVRPVQHHGQCVNPRS